VGNYPVFDLFTFTWIGYHLFILIILKRLLEKWHKNASTYIKFKGLKAFMDVVCTRKPSTNYPSIFIIFCIGK